MQQAPGRKQVGRAKVDASPHGPQVFSLAAARLKRRAAKNADKATLPELAGLDLRGVDLERMTESAREHFWFNMNRYARRLYGAAGELSTAETDLPSAPITADHVRWAELHRLRRLQRTEHTETGMTFLLDALQILGAALCGALATKPDLVGDAGFVPLTLALAGTVSVFLARELVTSRTA